MPSYNAPIRDYQFALNEFLEIQQYQGVVPGYDDLSIVDPILEESARFSQEVLFPLNQTGDEQGLKYGTDADGRGTVTLPDGFVDAYQAYVEAGWPSFACDPEYGGQGLPHVVNTPLIEMICSANLSFGLLPGLTHGAYTALHLFGTDEQKQHYLPKLTSGEWTGVMCLTEPQAGTDLGLLRTTATPKDDGSYAINGTKIFISCGEQDATPNIIHLILARLPGAPEGVKGISLFVGAKYNLDANGEMAERNNISCGSFEHKMGIHASPTCVMNYDDAKAYLVGEPHKGLRAMFAMMNEARLLVGMQGLGVAEVAYQNALEYAKERLQGRALKGAALPNKPADPITVHPDVRRMLLTMKSFTEGARILACWTALHVDFSHNHPDEEQRAGSDEFVQLMTPIVKAHLTEEGTRTANTAVQVLGGYGYIKEYGVEQYLRDARIAEIYEGTNGVQALDLVGRKLGMNTGRLLRRFFHPVEAFITENRDVPEMAEFTKPLYQAFRSLQQSSMWIAQKGLSNKDEAAGASADYLRLFSLVTLGYIWARSAKISLEKLGKFPPTESLRSSTPPQVGSNSSASLNSPSMGESDSGTESGGGEEIDSDFYEAKLATARFYLNKILPEHYSLIAKIVAGVKHLDMPEVALKSA